MLKKEDVEFKAIQDIMSDTTPTMNESQHQVHEKYCNKLKKNMNFS